MAYETVRFLTTTPWGPNFSPNGLLLSFVHQLTAYEDNNDGSHLPMVQPARELQRRVEDLDQAATKYRKKSTECTAALQGDLALCDDSEVKLLTESLMRSHKMLADYLEGLHPILRDHRESVKRLSEYLTPPTVELFQKKASHLLKDAPLQQISMAKRNTCTICMDASADCVIKRTCSDVPSSSASHHQVRCERDMCKCGPTMCRDCLLTHYWTSTGKGSKSYARCVCCRAEFCLKDVFPVQYVEDEAYILLKSEQEKKGKEREVAKPAVNDEEHASRGRRGRKSNLHANNTTTTTTTTTTTSTHSPSSFSPLGRYNTFPNDTYANTTTSSNNNNVSEEGCDEYGANRKRRKVNRENSNNSNTSNNSSNSHPNNNNVNTNNNYNNNESSDNERPKYHLRSSQRRSERQ